MNNEPNTPTRSTANAHNEQTTADTKKKYSVILRVAKISEFAVCIEASSKEEAAIRAEINTARKPHKRRCSGCQYYEVSHLSVDLVDEGQDND